MGLFQRSHPEVPDQLLTDGGDYMVGVTVGWIGIDETPVCGPELRAPPVIVQDPTPKCLDLLQPCGSGTFARRLQRRVDLPCSAVSDGALISSAYKPRWRALCSR
jgi:hypothetical protein